MPTSPTSALPSPEPDAPARMPLSVIAGFALAALATLMWALISLTTSHLRISAVDRVETANVNSRLLNEALLIVLNAETGQHGYLLSDDEAALQPFNDAHRQLPLVMGSLRASMATDMAQNTRLQSFESLVEEKILDIQRRVELQRSGRKAEALALERNSHSRQLTERIRDVWSDLTTVQNRQYAQQRQVWSDAARFANYASLSGAAVLLILIGLSAAMTRRDQTLKEHHNWVIAGISRLGERLQGDHRLNDIGQITLDHLCRYLQAPVGAAYALTSSGALTLIGGFGLPRDRLEQDLLAGEGLIAQAAQSRQLLHVRDLPANYLNINSSLGHSSPRELLLLPAVHSNEVLAVIELGFGREVGRREREYLERVTDLLAQAIRSGMDRARLEDLLMQTQRQSVELQSQQEELRVTNEELEQQSRILQKSQVQMEIQHAELEQTNSHLEQQRTQLLQSQAALTEQTKELQQASQFKSEFLANMSHELRTPLNSTLILAKLLTDNRQGNLTAEQIKYAQTIHAAGNDLLSLINDILDLSKIEAGQATVSMDTVELAPALHALLEPLRPLAAEKQLPLTLRIEPDVPSHFHTDPMRWAQVLKNLLANALKFTEQGHVNLHIRRAPDNHLAFAVTDTGIGITEAQQALIFDAFRQADGSTHRKYGGTGLGLSISRDLAHLLGGTLSVRSQSGAGSTFTLELPLHGNATAPAMPPALAQPVRATAPAALAAPHALQPAHTDKSRPSARGSAQRNTILIIEDDERYAHLLCELAHEQHFDCLQAATGAEGLTMAVQHAPSAIVLDINLPDYSGLGVLDQLKRNPATRHIPVHVISGADHAKDALRRGAVGYAVKPVQRDDLVQVLQRLQAKVSQRNYRVLVVEDDAVQCDDVRELLGRDGVDIVCASTAAAAIDHLRNATFDCMVMDLHLPDMSGFDLLKAMSGRTDATTPPVIVYTGHALSADEEQQLRRFSNAIVIKDARSPERLLDEVTLFLHQVESELTESQRHMLQTARHRDLALEGKTVLVVEDDVRNVFALTSVLEPTGVKVQIARNGREALEALEAATHSATPIDMILMDIMMPEMDGYTAMRSIRSQPAHKRLPIIALTAKAMKDDQEKCLAAGASDYIAKPLDVDKLLSLIRVWMPR